MILSPLFCFEVSNLIFLFCQKFLFNIVLRDGTQIIATLALTFIISSDFNIQTLKDSLSILNKETGDK